MEFPRPRTVAREIRGILADASIAESPPYTLAPPQPGAKKRERIVHGINTAMHFAGQAANRRYERSGAFWTPTKAPIPDVQTIGVLGYGNEKVVYKLTTFTGDAHALSVYHVESFFSDPERLLARKRRNYDTYRRYFGGVVHPTDFLVVNNPWGEGTKPATHQPFIEDKEEFQAYTPEELRTRTESDPAFATSLEALHEGYTVMRRDGLCPDFARSNLVVSGSNVVIFDTGHYFTEGQARVMRNFHPNYAKIEQLAA